MKGTKMLVLIIILIIVATISIVFSDILWLFAIAGLFAFLLNPLCRLIMVRFKVRKAFSMILIFFILGLLLWVLFSSLIRPLFTEVTTFLANFSTYTESLEVIYYNTMDWFLEIGIPQKAIDYINTALTDSGVVFSILSSMQSFASSLLVTLLTDALSTSAKILDVVIILTLTIYFMIDTRKLIKNLLSYLPIQYSEKISSLLSESYDVVWNYLKSKTLVSLGMGITTFIVFTIIGVDFALALATMAFVLDYIPYFGSIIAGIVSAFVALLTGGISQAIIVGICVLIIQQIEGNVVVPKVQGDSVGLHPIMVLFALLACNQLWGPFGMFIAVPLGGILKIVIRETYYFLKT